MVPVVIVTHNSARTLGACLASLQRQQVGHVVTLIDSGSSDESARIARAFAAARTVVKLGRNVGFAAASNVGIRLTPPLFPPPPWVLLLNPDAELQPGALRAWLDFAAQHPRAGAIGARLLNPDGSLQPSGRAFPTLRRYLLEVTGLWRLRATNSYLDSRRDYDRSVAIDEVSGAALLLRRQALDEVGLFDESFFLNWEDVDLCRRLRARGWEIWYCAEARVVHHFGVSRAPVGDFVRRVSEQSAEHYFRKWHGRGVAGLVKLVHRLKRLLRRPLPPRSIAAAVPPRPGPR